MDSDDIQGFNFGFNNEGSEQNFTHPQYHVGGGAVCHRVEGMRRLINSVWKYELLSYLYNHTGTYNLTLCFAVFFCTSDQDKDSDNGFHPNWYKNCFHSRVI